MLKHFLSLKAIIPNFVAFFVSLGIVITFIRKMSFLVTSAKQDCTPASHCFIIHLIGGGQCLLVRDSEPIKLLEIPTSPSLYMLMVNKREKIYCIISISDKQLSSFFISLILSLSFYSFLLFSYLFRFNFVVSELNVHNLFR